MARKRKKNPPNSGVLLAAGAVLLGIVGAVVAAKANKKKPKPKPTPKPDLPDIDPLPSRPSGNPPNPTGGNCRVDMTAYDQAFWDAGDVNTERDRIFSAFEDMGYETPADRDSMNDPGPDNALGGGDDLPNSEVKRFAREWNAVSRWGGWKSTSKMGGLDPDGLVGPCTLNALKYLIDSLGSQTWQSKVSQARAAGFKP